eukprot:1143672-Pelagomonas_calceolata.AAC.4
MEDPRSPSWPQITKNGVKLALRPFFNPEARHFSFHANIIHRNSLGSTSTEAGFAYVGSWLSQAYIRQ